MLWTAFFFNLLSLCSTIVVIYLFYVSRRYKFFEYRLVLYLQVADLILAISYIMIIFEGKIEQGALCQIHSFLGNFSNLTSVFFNITISTVLILTLRFNYYNTYKYEWLFSFNFGFPFIMNVMYNYFS